MQQDWTEQLRSRLDSYEEPVPERVWDETIRRSRDKARQVALRRWVAGVAAAVLLLAGSFIVWQDGNKPQPEADLRRGTIKSAGIAEHKAYQANDATSHAAAAHAVLSRRPQPANLQATASVPADTVRLVLQEMAQEVLQNVAQEVAHDVRADTIDPTIADAAAPAAISASHQRDQQQGAQLPYHRGGHSSPRQLTFSLRTSNLLASGGTTTLTPMQMSRNYMGAASEAFSRQSPMYLVGYDEEAHHRLPIMFGMSVSMPLSSRWWLETGLSYTRLWSTFTHRYAAIVQVDDQHLSYVGLPVAAGYSFWQTPRLSAYATAGVAADWCVSATITSGSIRRDRVQLSASVGVGLQYRLLSSLGVYVQPSMRYYPDNGSALQNVYKESPVQLDLQLGLRYTLK